jgi:hypothetical protein
MLLGLTPLNKSKDSERWWPGLPRGMTLERSFVATSSCPAPADPTWSEAPCPWRDNTSRSARTSTLRRQHLEACTLAEIASFVPYTFRHTCLTRWAKILDPYTLAYLAGHSDFGTTRRYVHPNLNTAREAFEKARSVQGGHKSGHKSIGEETLESTEILAIVVVKGLGGMPEWIRTTDLLLRRQTLYPG